MPNNPTPKQCPDCGDTWKRPYYNAACKNAFHGHAAPIDKDIKPAIGPNGERIYGEYTQNDMQGELGHEARLIIADMYIAGRTKQKWADVQPAAEASLKALLAQTREQTKTYERVTRFEVIDHREVGEGRVFVAWPSQIWLSYQDDGRTLKVFIRDVTKEQSNGKEA